MHLYSLGTQIKMYRGLRQTSAEEKHYLNMTEQIERSSWYYIAGEIKQVIARWKEVERYYCVYSPTIIGYFVVEVDWKPGKSRRATHTYIRSCPLLSGLKCREWENLEEILLNVSDPCAITGLLSLSNHSILR